MSKNILKIGTRGSRLALWQANYTLQKLSDAGIEAELVIIKTQGDKIQHLTFDKLEGKGFFTKEIEDALLNGSIDLAVHSMKDLPTASTPGLVITAVSYRENPADWLIINKSSIAEDQTFKLKERALIGTSSARRQAQLLDFRPDLQFTPIRGNVPTRLKKMQNGEADAVMLAAAGLKRLEIDLSEFELVAFHPREFVPAPAQGVLAYQTRKEDLDTRRLLKILHHSDVAEVTNIERKVLQLMEGGCQMPLGVYCERDQQGNYHVWAANAESATSAVSKVKHSSSTNHGLAKAVVEALQKA